jgi:type I restriction enzyme, S subunit
VKAGWTTRLISDICLVTDYVANGSFAALRENVSYLDGDGFAIVVRLTDSTKNWNGNYKYVSESAYHFLKKSALFPGDLVMSNVGEPGKVFVVPGLGKPMTLGPNSILIRPSTAHVSAQFLFHYFSSNDGRSKIDEISEGVAQKKFNKTAFRSLDLSIPPIEEQSRIVTLLDEAFADIATAKANAEKNLQNAEFLFQSQLQALLNRPSGGRVQTTLGKATGGIFTGPFGSLLHKHDYVENGIPLVNPAHISPFGIEPDHRKTVSNETASRLASYIMRAGDIVIGRRGEMGRCALITDVEDGWLCGTGSFFIKPSNQCNAAYLVHLLRSDGCKQQLEKIAGGAVMPNLSNTDLSNFVLELPPVEEQKQIVDQIELAGQDVERLKSIYRQKLTALDDLKKSLLHQAFSGLL